MVSALAIFTEQFAKWVNERCRLPGSHFLSGFRIHVRGELIDYLILKQWPALTTLIGHFRLQDFMVINSGILHIKRVQQVSYIFRFVDHALS